MMAGVAGPIALGALALNAIFGKKRTPHTGGAAVADASGVSALALKEANIGFAADKSDDVQKMVSSVAASSAALLNAVSAMQGRTGFGGARSARAIPLSGSGDLRPPFQCGPPGGAVHVS